MIVTFAAMPGSVLKSVCMKHIFEFELITVGKKHLRYS